MLKRVASSWPALLLAAILLGPFLPYLIAPAGRIIGNPLCDNPSQFYYYNEFAGRCWRQGIVPLWNPHIMFGLPFAGEGQAAIFHPLSWLFAFLPTGAALNWLMALCFLLGGMFFYGYLRTLRLGRAAALGGALAWAFSSVPISRLYAGHLSMLLVFMPMPAVLMFWERFRASGRPGNLLGIALAYGAMILGGHPQTLAIFSLFFMAHVVIYGVLGARRGGALRKEARGALWAGGAIVLGIAVGAVQLLTTADFAAISFRTASSLEFSGSYSFAPENLLTWLAPRFFGFDIPPGNDLYWGRLNYWEMWAYIGIAPLLLAAPGFLAAPRRRRITLAACALIFLVFALGRHTPLFPLLYHTIPFFRIFRGASKNIMIVQLCLVTLGAYGIEGLLNFGEAARRRRRALYLAGAAAIVLLLGIYLWFIPGHALPGSHWRGLLQEINTIEEGQRAPDITALETVRATAGCAAAQLWRSILLAGAVLGAAAAAGRWTRGRRLLAPALLGLILLDLYGVFRPMLKDYPESITRYPDTLVAPLKGYPYPPRILESNQNPNVAMHHGYSEISGYTGNTLGRFNLFINRIQNQDPRMQQSDHPFNENTPIFNFFAFDAMIRPADTATHHTPPLGSGEGLILVPYPNPWPRAYLAAAPRNAPAGEDEAIRMVLADPDRLLESPVVERGGGGPAAAPLGAEEKAQIVAFTPNRVELDVRAGGARTLVLCEMFEKNWTAKVNNAATPVYPANYLFRAVDVPGGSSRVVFEYRPAAVRWGAAITLVALGGMLAGTLWARGRRVADEESLDEEPAANTVANAAPATKKADATLKTTPLPAKAARRRSR